MLRGPSHRVHGDDAGHAAQAEALLRQRLPPLPLRPHERAHASRASERNRRACVATVFRAAADGAARPRGVRALPLGRQGQLPGAARAAGAAAPRGPRRQRAHRAAHDLRPAQRRRGAPAGALPRRRHGAGALAADGPARRAAQRRRHVRGAGGGGAAGAQRRARPRREVPRLRRPARARDPRLARARAALRAAAGQARDGLPRLACRLCRPLGEASAGRR
mmetsp:Transcript_11129/g.33870  ORF Transcript_11129/g.33870 Transcript_11129/m.33870 type:complete len:221 (-) Transcript_11129:273-935(-)